MIKMFLTFTDDWAWEEVSHSGVAISWIIEVTQSLKWILRVGYIVKKWSYHGVKHMDVIDLEPWILYEFANLQDYWILRLSSSWSVSQFQSLLPSPSDKDPYVDAVDVGSWILWGFSSLQELIILRSKWVQDDQSHVECQPLLGTIPWGFCCRGWYVTPFGT